MVLIDRYYTTYIHNFGPITWIELKDVHHYDYFKGVKVSNFRKVYKKNKLPLIYIDEMSQINEFIKYYYH